MVLDFGSFFDVFYNAIAITFGVVIFISFLKMLWNAVDGIRSYLKK